jgi:hypothetical protein
VFAIASAVVTGATVTLAAPYKVAVETAAQCRIARLADRRCIVAGNVYIFIAIKAHYASAELQLIVAAEIMVRAPLYSTPDAVDAAIANARLPVFPQLVSTIIAPVLWISRGLIFVG